MQLFTVLTGKATSEEDASHLLIRAADAAEARSIARAYSAYFFGDDDSVWVAPLSADGAPGVVDEFRRPV